MNKIIKYFHLNVVYKAKVDILEINKTCYLMSFSRQLLFVGPTWFLFAKKTKNVDEKYFICLFWFLEHMPFLRYATKMWQICDKDVT